jgi:hypothetical protein
MSGGMASQQGHQSGYAFDNRGRAWLYKDNPERAIADFRKAVEINSNLLAGVIGTYYKFWMRANRAQTVGQLPNAPINADQLLDSWLVAKGVAKDARSAFVARFNQLIVSRPKWDERHKYEKLSHLSAPRFLRAVYADVIDENGRLTNEDVVRLSDPNLVRIVQGYINKRIRHASVEDQQSRIAAFLAPIHSAPVTMARSVYAWHSGSQ